MSRVGYRSVLGCILGTAVGDAIGLPYEGLSRQRLSRLCPKLERHSLILGRGLVSDDTEHTLMVAQSLAASAGEPDCFANRLAGRLRRWLLCVPAGAGLATARATAKLLVGFSPSKSGVFSAGNGPAMRSAIIGVCFGGDPQVMASLVRVSTRITHTDPKAEYGAVAVAQAAYLSSQGVSRDDGFQDSYLQQIRRLLPIDSDSAELLQLLLEAAESAKRGEDTASFAAGMGWTRGIGGYIYATVPAVIHSWFRHPADYPSAITELVMCGGDTDTTAAIAGGIIGANVGVAGLPSAWLQGLAEWPCGIGHMKRLAEQLCAAVNGGIPQQVRTPVFPLVLVRNVLFLAVVLAHGFRRLLPPY